jgi:acetoin utilization protein AcuC
MRPIAHVYSDALMSYDLGPHHPLKPRRLRLTQDLLEAYGMVDLPEVRVVTPEPAPARIVERAHDLAYLDALRRLSAGEPVPNARSFGFGTGDNPVVPGMWESSLLYTGASYQAADLVARGEVPVAFNIGGGLHHAMRARAAGFCVLDDPVVAALRLRETFDRVCYVDIDAHHGDGVQDYFYADPSVLTVSMHESGRYLFPGTGFVDEIGREEGVGFSLNTPTFPGSSDSVYLRLWDEVVEPIVRAFDPQAIVAQLGCDAHYADPLTHLALTTHGFTALVRRIVALGKPVVATGGGGYNVTTVPRAWTLAFAALAEMDDPPNALPPLVRETLGLDTLHDEEADLESNYAEQADRHAEMVIEEVRRLLFPRYNLA